VAYANKRDGKADVSAALRSAATGKFEGVKATKRSRIAELGLLARFRRTLVEWKPKWSFHLPFCTRSYSTGSCFLYGRGTDDELLRTSAGLGVRASRLSAALWPFIGGGVNRTSQPPRTDI